MSEDSKSTDVFGLQAVRELVQLIGHTDITELLIEKDGGKLHLKRSGVIYSHATSVVSPVLSASQLAPLGSLHHTQQSPSAQAQLSSPSHPVDLPAGYTIFAPMVGTFYNSPSPKDPSFVQEGDEIHVGDTVGIIEAMKIMNEIESEVKGRVVRIMVKNEQPVEYGQPLMVIEPL